MTTPLVIADGLGFPESTRWHDGRVWICNWGTGEVIAFAPDGGERSVVARVAPHTLPFSIDWLPDGRLLVIDGPERRLLVAADDGLADYADLTDFGPDVFNEIVVADSGAAYVNGAGGVVVLVRPDRSVRVVAEDLQFPNGMALVDEGRTLVVADSHARQLVGFDVAADGTLANRRTWAEVEHAPDGICADAEGTVWAASVPGQYCVRVAEGGEVLDTVEVDRGCFACMLGGADGRTLFIGAAEWRGMDAAMTEGPGTSGRLLAAPGRPAPHAGRP